MKKRVTCIVSGRVQMVMYRDFTERRAKKLGLLGTVQNLKDGNVSVVAEGEENLLQTFTEFLKRGSPFSKVQNMSVTWSEPTGEFQNFRIVYRNFFDRI